ncbi:MAG: PP2C family protein-serine/threonine phosphatase [Cytophagales bacterium]|nr:PP2C family protein-serine/threonine phosphatase [Cytophagales bacterium]
MKNMYTSKLIPRLSILLAIISWLTSLATSSLKLLHTSYQLPFSLPIKVSYSFFGLYMLLLAVFFRYNTQRAERINLINLLWRASFLGVIALATLAIIRLRAYLPENYALVSHRLIANFFYHVELGLIMAFFLATFTVWKRLILYQKTKRLLRYWNIFEYTLFSTIILIFIPFEGSKLFFNALYMLLTGLGVVLALHLKWIAYLNFKQKWQGLLIVLLIIALTAYFSADLFGYIEAQDLLVGLANSLFTFSLFTFLILYGMASLLVILFNLPTSSVFEKKLIETDNLGRLSQSIQTSGHVNHVYEVLLDSTHNTVAADAVWLELNQSSRPIKIISKNISVAEIKSLKQSIKKPTKNFFKIETPLHKSETKQTPHNFQGRSLLILPLVVKHKNIGILVVVKEVTDGFTKEMVDIIHTFVQQTCISIENFHLLREMLENERYKEALKIAKRVQQRLLPEKLPQHESFEITAFSQATDQVGGDYYDFYRLSKQRIALIIGDVAGKGTSAAFNMSQMKGLFHALVQQNLSPRVFLMQANKALSRCLEKSSFITASYCVIDTQKRTFSFSRAGHCPIIYYNSVQQSTRYLESKGLGLGIIKDEKFTDYIASHTLKFNKGDIVLLYTDGIIEAKNKKEEHFGEERLIKVVEENRHKAPSAIQHKLLEAFYTFCNNYAMEDDYTCIIVKFK